LGGERADVVVGIDGERLHLSFLFLTGYRDAHIHHSGRESTQVDSAGNRKGEGLAMVAGGQIAPGCVQ